MNSLLQRFGRPIALCLTFLVTAQLSEAAALPIAQEQAPAQQQPAQQPAQQDQQQQPANQPQRPATDPQQQPAAMPDAPAAPAQQPADSQQQDAAPGFASRSQDQEQPDTQKPVGTAVGPSTRPTGVAGSRPAGAAIAPAKQKRVKALYIRIGLIVAGAAAVGAVYGLSKGSPSHPPQ